MPPPTASCAPPMCLGEESSRLGLRILEVFLAAEADAFVARRRSGLGFGSWDSAAACSESIACACSKMFFASSTACSVFTLPASAASSTAFPDPWLVLDAAAIRAREEPPTRMTVIGERARLREGDDGRSFGDAEPWAGKGHDGFGFRLVEGLRGRACPLSLSMSGLAVSGRRLTAHRCPSVTSAIDIQPTAGRSMLPRMRPLSCTTSETSTVSPMLRRPTSLPEREGVSLTKRGWVTR
mmetsp:Transcript_9611/g.34135  ORF Transcript_9611/g.34135 Transcript_9611/m.34135 type:complete len:239 (-) Transcript_9611:1105-1821(-)